MTTQYLKKTVSLSRQKYLADFSKMLVKNQITIAVRASLERGNLSILDTPKYISNFSKTIKSILELLDLETEDDYGVLKPTDYSFKTTINLLIEAYEVLGVMFPRGLASTDDEGGIRINWKNRDQDCRVCLFCPSNTEDNLYIYHQYQDDYGSDQEVTLSSLIKWLNWFNKYE